MPTWEPTDLEVLLALGFENLCACLRDTVRGHGLHKSNWAERINKNVKKYSKEWYALHRCILDTDDIPELLSTKDPKKYHRRQKGRVTDQKLAQERANVVHYRLLHEAARMSGTEFDPSKSIDEFPSNLFYSEKPWVTTTIEHLPRRTGNDLVFFKFFNDSLEGGRVPEHVWLQAKLHLFLIEDHMKQGQGGYFDLNSTLIAICLTPDGNQEHKLIRIDEGDNLKMLIRDSADYYIGALLPSLHECRCPGNRHDLVNYAQPFFEDFIPEQDRNKIEVGTTVYSVTRKQIGVVKEIVNAHREAKVAWECNPEAKLRRCEISNLIATSVKKRIEPKSTGERVVVLGANDPSLIGRQGIIQTYNSFSCEVLLNGRSAEVRKISRKLLHSLAPTNLLTYGPRETLRVPFEGNPMQCLDEVNQYLLEEGQGFQIIKKYATVFNATQYESLDEELESRESSSKEEGWRRVEEYCRLASFNSIVSKGYSDDRLEELNTNASLWLSDWDINAYIWYTNTRLANSYECMYSNDPMQYIWVCQSYVYASIENCIGDFSRMKSLWKRIPHFAEFLLLPVGASFHWSLLLIAYPLDPQETFVLHLDSMSKGSYNADRIDIGNIRLFLSAGNYIESGDKFEYDDLHVETSESPQQPNGHDCGPYTLACIQSFINEIECKSRLSDKNDVVSLINDWEFSAHTAEEMRSKVYDILSAVESSGSFDSIS